MNKKTTNQNERQEAKEKPAGDEPRGIFGKWLKFLYEATFILTILIFGTLCGTLIACILPLGFPLLILWKRYVQGDGVEA